MRTPLPVGTPIDDNRKRQWMEDFTGYRVPVTQDRIDQWLSRFDAANQDVAARLLDAVLFVSSSDVTTAFRAILASLDGWALSEDDRRGRWMFVPFTGSAGESGDHMLERFRHANNLKGRKYSNLFCYRSDLVEREPGPQDTVVLVDDFSGTGDQACAAWKLIFQELLPLRPRVLLVLLAASNLAQARIATETSMKACAHIDLSSDEDIFSAQCDLFSDEEKARLLHYGQRADRKHPRGWGDCGFVIVFPHTTPNNSIPLLHKRKTGRWEGLFPRYD